MIKGMEYTIQEIEEISGLSGKDLSSEGVESVLAHKYRFKAECFPVGFDVTPDDMEMINWLGDDYDIGEPVFVVVFS